jgi:hypothetical protein
LTDTKLVITTIIPKTQGAYKPKNN